MPHWRRWLSLMLLGSVLLVSQGCAVLGVAALGAAAGGGGVWWYEKGEETRAQDEAILRGEVPQQPAPR